MTDIKFSDFPKATESKNTDEIAILQDGINKTIQSPILESKIIQKVKEFPVIGKVEQGNSNTVSGNDVYNAINRTGIFNEQNYDILNVIKFNLGVGFDIENNENIDSVVCSSDFIEIKSDEDIVLYKNMFSSYYGINFYDQDKAFLKGFAENNDNENKFTINTNGLQNAKFFKVNGYSDGVENIKAIVYYNKNKRENLLLNSFKTDVNSIKTKEDVINLSDKIYFTENIQGIPLLFTEVINIERAKKITTVIPRTSSTFIFLYDENLSLIKEIKGDNKAFANTIVKYTDDDLDNAKYCQIGTELNLEPTLLIKKDIVNNIKELSTDYNLSNLKKGNNVTYINFDSFDRIGIVRKNGILDESVTSWKSVLEKELPKNWSKIQFHTPLASVTNLILYDINKRLIYVEDKSNNHNPLFKEINFSDFPDAYYYSFSYEIGSEDFLFRIFLDLNRKIDYEYKKFNPIVRTFSDIGETETLLFDGSEWNESNYARIPTCYAVNENISIFATELRKSTEDVDKMSIGVRREVNGVLEPVSIVFENNETYGRYMNPCFVKKGNELYLFVGSIKSYMEIEPILPRADFDIFYKVSTDDGATWSDAVSLKSYFGSESKFTGVMPSPTNGIVMKNGTIVIPAMCVKNGTWFSSLFYKKEGGNWFFSATSSRILDNESLCYEYNGKLILDCRNDSVVGYTRSVYEYNFQEDILVPYLTDKKFYNLINSQMSVDKIKYKGLEIFLMTYPDNTETLLYNPFDSRKNLTLWASLDGIEWMRIYVFHAPISLGYSVVSVNGNKVIITYESNTPYLSVYYQDITDIIPTILDNFIIQNRRPLADRLTSATN